MAEKPELEDLVCTVIKRSSEVCGLGCFSTTIVDELDCAQTNTCDNHLSSHHASIRMIPIIDNHREESHKVRLAGMGNSDFQILP